MEHSLLTDPVQLGRENLLETYLGLAKAVPEATVSIRDNCIVARGPEDLSFCNFIAGFGPVENPAARLSWIAEEASQHSSLWVFSIEGDQPYRIDKDLQARGFVQRQFLNQMILVDDTQLEKPPTVQIRIAESQATRVELCRFAARTFFTRTPDDVQNRIAEATANSKHQLYGMSDDKGPSVAMMLCESESCLGLYNLCVRSDWRRRGLGGEMVAFAKEKAHELNRPLVLQCDSSLIRWYENRGFHSFGTVRAYTFSPGHWRDII